MQLKTIYKYKKGIVFMEIKDFIGKEVMSTNSKQHYIIEKIDGTFISACSCWHIIKKEILNTLWEIYFPIFFLFFTEVFYSI